MSIDAVNTPAFQPVSEQVHFSQAVKSGGFVFCSGATGAGPDGKVPKDLKEEFRNAFESVKTVLAEAGASLSDVVEMTTYHVDMDDTMRTFWGIREEFMSAPWCAWSAIGITSLSGGAKVEIRAIAKLP